MRKILASKRGEMYFEVAITLLILMTFLVFAMSAIGVVNTKRTADYVADQLLETATYYGCFGTEFDERLAELQAENPTLTFTVDYTGEWLNETLERVQLGNKMQVVVSYEVALKGFGSYVNIPLKTIRTGASENFWKTDAE